ncbi:MAG TPA: hydrogenase nickel incorporation protein HypB [Candidatus Synoicihabitans sp.]|nr:hydrogenase nickel incorporation protein HypB [Candidatus Synoicihabitans sp.]
MTNLQTGRHVHLPSDFDPGAGAAMPVAHTHESPDAHTRQAEHESDYMEVDVHSHGHVLDGPHIPRVSKTGRTIHLEQELLAKNTRLAERNRGWLAGRGVVALNIMSSPGAGKTTLLERTLKELGGQVAFHVIEGDQATLRDAERIRAAGGKAVQVNTGSGCHLDAAMVAAALQQLDPPPGGIVLIENVGNLVCPALFDLGEHARVVVASVTEGDDKPMKYPHMFRVADVIVLNKTDLCPHVEFDVPAFERRARDLNPNACLIQLSALRGTGMDGWLQWLLEARRGVA